MKSEDKIREALSNYQKTLDAGTKAREALVTATQNADEAYANAQRVMHAVLGSKSRDGVVFNQEKWWIDTEDRLRSEPFKATVL